VERKRVVVVATEIVVVEEKEAMVDEGEEEKEPMGYEEVDVILINLDVSNAESLWQEDMP